MRAAALLPLLLLAACQDEPTFDDRYDAAAKEIEARAKAMDADVGAADAAEKGLQENAAAAKAPPSSGE